MMDKYFKVSNLLLFVNSNFIFLTKKKDVFLSLSIFLTSLCYVFHHWFYHVRQIQNKAELKIIKMTVT